MIRQVEIRKKRPLGVTLFALVYSWIGWCGSIALLVMAVSGSLLDVQRMLISTFTDPGALIRIGAWIVVAIWWLFYVLYGFLGFGLWKLREWSRRAVLALSGLFTLLSVAILPFVLKALILFIPIMTGTVLFFGLQFWYLSRPTVRYAFRDGPLADAHGSVPPPPLTVRSGRRRLAMVGIVLGAFALFLCAVMFAAGSLLKNSVPYKMSLEEAAHSPCVASALGPQLNPGWNISGNLEETGGEGKADLSIPIRGSKGRGTLQLTAEKVAGSWQINTLTLERGKSEVEIVPAQFCP